LALIERLEGEAMRTSFSRFLAVLLFTPLMGIAQAETTTPECFPEPVLSGNRFPSVRLETSMGDIVVELDRKRAPVTANNFLRYVLEKKYDNTIFHRVIEGFVVQGGGYSETLDEPELHAPIINESGNGLMNSPMTIAMARFDDPHSATNQFFFNVAENSSLNPNPRSWGYTVFGSVISGQDVVEAISRVETGYNENFDSEDVPLVPVKLLSATVLEEPH
jgi:peptidyl-prolyl cis-trans isomerase A (cyclophilin A)